MGTESKGLLPVSNEISEITRSGFFSLLDRCLLLKSPMRATKSGLERSQVEPGSC